MGPVLLFLGAFVASFLHILHWALRVRTMRKILDVFDVFLGVFEKNKEKKDRGGTAKIRSWTHVRRNGAFRARSQGFPIFDCRNKAF